MFRKGILGIALIVTFFLLNSPFANASETAILLVNDSRFRCEVYAPLEARTDEPIIVTFAVTPWRDLHLVGETQYIWVSLRGPIGINGEYSEWEHEWKDQVLYQYPSPGYRVEHTFTVHRNQSLSWVGDVWGTIEAHYRSDGQEYAILIQDFKVVRIYARTHEMLATDFDSLQDDYTLLNSKYDSLQEEARAANNVRLLAYLFAATAVAFIGTTIWLALRKPRTKVA